eukprot:6217621-Amphidinium_carterae.2
MQDRQAGDRCCFSVCQWGNFAVPPFISTWFRNTLLHYSAGYGRTKFLELLFEQGHIVGGLLCCHCEEWPTCDQQSCLHWRGIEKVKNAVNKEGQTVRPTQCLREM